MQTYVKIFEELKNESSRKAKEEILKKYEDNEGFKEILQFIYDPMIVTGLAKKKIEKSINGVSSINLRNIFEAMNFVVDNNTGNDAVILAVQKFLKTLNKEEKELASNILIKDMPIGLSSTTLNKVYGSNFINKYGVQLASKYEFNEKQFDGDFSLSLKLDGNRITFFTYETGIRAFSRSGKEMLGLTELFEAFDKLPKNMAYDGELLAIDDKQLDSSDLFRKTQTIARRKGEKVGLQFVMFDMLPIIEFNKGISKLIYEDRLMKIKQLFLDFITNDMPIKLVPIYYTGNDKSVIPQYLSIVEEQGLEGLMINTLNGKYQTKRSKDLLKVKTFHTLDLRCIGIKEGIRGNECGSITVMYKGFEVDVAGLNDKQKEMFWKNPETIVGKIVEIKYFEESKNAQGNLSLRFTSLIAIREDKNEVSYN